MSSRQVHLPDMTRIRIITEYDDMVIALDRKKYEIGKAGFEEPIEERDRFAHQIAAVCEDQVPLQRKANEIRGTVCALVEAGAYWLALEALRPAEAARIRQGLEPTVQRMRDARDQQETVQ